MDLNDQIKEKQEGTNKLDNNYLRISLKRCEEIKKIVSSFSELDDTDKNFNILRESFRRFKTILEVEIIEICNKISQIDKASYKGVRCLNEITEYLLVLSNLPRVIVKIQNKFNELEDNICQAKSNITIDNFDVIVIKEIYDLVVEIKKSMYEYFIGIPEKHLYINSYTSSNHIKNTYEEIMEHINKIMGNRGVNKDLYERPYSERIASYFEAWRNNLKGSIPFGLVEY